MTLTGYAIAAALVLLCSTLFFSAGYIIESATVKRLRREVEIFREMVISNREKDYSERRCWTCAHARPDARHEGVMLCTKHPPQAVKEEAALFPIVLASDRCGEYEKGRTEQ